MPAAADTHATREGDSVTWNKAPDCEVHKGNYQEKVPAVVVMRTVGNGYHYLCGECQLFFTHEEAELGTGVGQRIVVNARAKASPPPPTEFPWPAEPKEPKPAKKAAAPVVPRLASVPPTPTEQTEAYDKRAAAKKVAAAKKQQKADAEGKRIAERMAADAAKVTAAKERAAAREATLAEPSLQQEVQKTIIEPNAQPEAAEPKDEVTP